MRSLRFHMQLDGKGISVRISKVQYKRMFMVYWKVEDQSNETTFAMQDGTDIPEYYEGMVMSPSLNDQTIIMIKQYFGKVKAVIKLEDDDYDDYDDY